MVIQPVHVVLTEPPPREAHTDSYTVPTLSKYDIRLVIFERTKEEQNEDWRVSNNDIVG